MAIKKGIQGILSYFGYRVQKKDQSPKSLTKASALLEIDLGHAKSKEAGQSIDAQGNPIPWFTYPSIEYFKQLNLKSKIMLEWGSGNSSRFFSERVKMVYSVEHNEEWYNHVSTFEITNQKLRLSASDYAQCASDFNERFDIILIDGIERHACAKMSQKLLKQGGLIILDNSDRYPDIAKMFRESGLIEIDFHGFGPINDYTWTTSIFLDRTINLEPIEDQPGIPIGGGY